jgi:hypothetical protein
MTHDSHQRQLRPAVRAVVGALLLLATLATGAVAGTPDDPEVVDAALDAGAANAWADLVAAWFEADAEADVLRVTLALGPLPAVQPGVAYGVVFDAADQAWYLALVPETETHYWYGDWDREQGGPTGEPRDGAGSYATGLEGRVVLGMPMSALGVNATRLERIEAHVIEFKPDLADAGIVFLDSAEARRDFTLPASAAREADVGPAAPTSEPAPAEGATEAVAPAATVDEPPPGAEGVPAPPLVLALLAVLVPALGRGRRRG